MTSDGELLRRYAETNSEDSFAELVRRHLDLVFSAALRQVNGDAHLAQEVAQTVFTDLARKAASLSHRPVLTGWLYTSAHFAAAKAVRTEQRRQTREQEAHAMQALLHDSGPNLDWERLRSVLDSAMHELNEPDREVILLRYFENRQHADIGEQVGLSENAARMRVERALEKLRHLLSRRGVTTGTAALSTALLVNAVQGAPAGLAVAISSAAAGLAGTTLAATATATATQALAMTTLQKTIIGAALAAAVGTGIYEARQASQLREQNQTLQQQQAPLTDQVRQLQRERDEASNRLAALTDEIARFRAEQKQAEVLRLRGQVGTLKSQLASTEAKMNSPASGIAKLFSDPTMKPFMQVAMQDMIKRRYGPLFQELKLTPEQADRVIQLMSAHFTGGVERLVARQQAGAGASPVQPAQTEAEQNAEFGRQLASVLGPNGIARFQEFSTEIPARTVLDQLNGQLGGSELSDEQTARLFQAVKAEPNELTKGITGEPDEAFFRSQADIDNLLRKVAESNQRVLQQAAQFLNPEQLAALNTVLSNGINARIAQGAAFTPKQ